MKMRGFSNFGIAVFAALILTPFAGAQEIQELQDPPGVRELYKVCVTATCSNPMKSAFAVGCSTDSVDEARMNAHDKATQLLGSCNGDVSYTEEQCSGLARCPFTPNAFRSSQKISNAPGEACWEVIVQGTSRDGGVLIVAGYGRNRNEAYRDAKNVLCWRAQAACICICRICIQSANDYCEKVNCECCPCSQR